MTDLYDKDGTLIEGALTEEEYNEKLDETKKEQEKVTQDKVDELNKEIGVKEQSLKDAEELLEKEKDKDKNLKGQRETIEGKEGEITELKKSIEDMTTKIDGLTTASQENKLLPIFDKLANGNEELGKKIKFHYDSFKGVPADEEERKKRLESAYILATGGKKPSAVSGVVASAAGGSAPMGEENAGKEKLSTEGKAFLPDFGISDKEAKEAGLI